MANDKKSEGGKAPAKVETINLKVSIHCEGCKKKVKKTLNNVEGVHTVDVDGSLGKVTVTGTVDSKVLIKKLEKAGKVAEVLPSGGGGKGKEQKDQQKGENKDAKEEKSGGGEGEKKGKGGGGSEAEKKGKGDNNGGENSNNNKGNHNGGGNANNGESGKKKKGGGGEGGNGGEGVDEAGFSKNTASKNIAPIMIETGYSSMESADYATHIFSDENANNCHIM